MKRIPKKKKKQFDQLVFRIIELGKRRVVNKGYPQGRVLQAGIDAWHELEREAKLSGLGKLLDDRRYFSRSRVKAFKRLVNEC